jgi:hypothetical protein
VLPSQRACCWYQPVTVLCCGDTHLIRTIESKGSASVHPAIVLRYGSATPDFRRWRTVISAGLPPCRKASIASELKHHQGHFFFAINTA